MSRPRVDSSDYRPYVGAQLEAPSYSSDIAKGNEMKSSAPSGFLSLALPFLVLLLFIGCSSDDGNPTSPAPDPTANFTWSGDLVAPARVTFANQSSNANRYSWNFGDGNSSTERNPTHVFETARSFQVTLTATDSVSGKSASLTKVITILQPDPIAEFTWSGATATPAQITFANRSLYADRFQWEFGDGRTSTQENPSITYTTRGTYSIRLIASNATTARADTITKSITITPGSCYLEAFLLNDIPWTRLDGTAWDALSAPDPQIDFCDAAGNILLSTAAVQDIRPSDLPLQWNLPTPYRFASLVNEWSFRLYDEDVSTYEVMGRISFRMSALAAAGGYLQTYTLSSGSFRMRINVRWE